MQIKNVLQRIKNAYKVKTYKELAKKFGVSYSSIDNWKLKKDIPEKYLLKTAQECHVDFEWLQTGKESDKTEKTKISINNKLANFPLKIIILLYSLLEEYKDIQNKAELIEKSEEFSCQSTNNFSKINQKTLASFIKYFLADRDIQFIFTYKNYYFDVLELIQDTKRFL